jgi:hypothetical protein
MACAADRNCSTPANLAGVFYFLILENNRQPATLVQFPASLVALVSGMKW